VWVLGSAFGSAQATNPFSAFSSKLHLPCLPYK
jgi:hypothetical protein